MGTVPSIFCGLANSSGRPLANSPRCVKRGLWLAMYTLVRLGVSVRNETYSRRKQRRGVSGHLHHNQASRFQLYRGNGLNTESSHAEVSLRK